MSSIDWEKYVTEVIKIFREEFDNLKDPEIKEMIGKELYEDTFLKPCQVEVLASTGEVVCFVAHDKGLDDMQIKIRLLPVSASLVENSEFLRKYDFGQHEPEHGRTISSYELSEEKWVSFLTKSFTIPVSQSTSPQMIVLFMLARLNLSAAVRSRVKRVTSLEKSTNRLQQSISELPENELRSRIEEQAKGITSALGDIKRIDKDVLEMRKLMGVSKEYQEWRTLITDVDRLKGEHVPKGEFEKEIGRLDEKISSLNASLNARINDLKEVRFARSRTILEIALGIMTATSTIIAALFAAHII